MTIPTVGKYYYKVGQEVDWFQLLYVSEHGTPGNGDELYVFKNEDGGETIFDRREVEDLYDDELEAYLYCSGNHSRYLEDVVWPKIKELENK